MRILLYILIIGSFGIPLRAQLPAAVWKGELTQTGGQDTFSYELHLQEQPGGLSGTAFSVNPAGDTAQFAVRGSWDGERMLLQEIKQERPEQPRWCLKYVKLDLGMDALGRSRLVGSWQAQGCRPGTLWLYPVDATLAATDSPLGRWTGYLDQADREYGFFYEFELAVDGTGRSRIVSEGSGGIATHALRWTQDTVLQLIRITELEVVEKTDPNWPWCIKQAELTWDRQDGRHTLSGNWSGFIEGYALRGDQGTCASGKIYLEKPILQLATRQKVEDKATVYEKEHGRKLRVDRVIQVSSPKLRIRVWDNGTVDGDIVTIFLNGKQLVKDFRVSKRKWSIPVSLTEAENLLIIHAEDLGDITPNTVAVSIDDGKKEEVLVISSNLSVSGGILIQPFTFSGSE